MDSVYELVGLWMTIQTLAWHLNSLDGIGIVADAKVYLYCIAAKALQKPTWHEYDWKGVLKILRKCNIHRWEPQNRHWKLGQQAPSVGTILT